MWRRTRNRIARRRSAADHRTVRCRRGRSTRRAARGSSPAVRRRRAEEPRAPADPRRGSAASPTAGRSTRRARAAARVLRRREAGTATSRAASSSRSGSCSPARSSSSASNPSPPAAGARRASTRCRDLDLASRLSFFLWSSIPDDALLTAAERGELRDPAGARAAGAADARRPARRGAGRELRRPVALPAQPRRAPGPIRRRSPTSTTTCGSRCGARPSCSSRASCGRTAASSSC